MKISISLPAPLVAKLDTLAMNQTRTRSNMLKYIIEQYLEEWCQELKEMQEKINQNE